MGMVLGGIVRGVLPGGSLLFAIGFGRGMSDRRDSKHDRATREKENERRAETERRGEQLREAWRQRHPERGRDEPKREEGAT